MLSPALVLIIDLINPKPQNPVLIVGMFVCSVHKVGKACVRRRLGLHPGIEKGLRVRDSFGWFRVYLGWGCKLSGCRVDFWTPRAEIPSLQVTAGLGWLDTNRLGLEWV